MFWTSSGTGMQLAVQFLAIMALARLLTPTEFGVIAAANVVVGLSQILSQIGVGPALVQRKELGATHIRVAVTISVLMGLLLGAGVYLAAPAIADFYRIPQLTPVLRVLALLFPLDGLNAVAKSLLTRELRFRLYIALDAGSYILGYAIVAVLLAWLGFGVWSLVFASLAELTLRSVSMYLAVRHSLRPSFHLPAARTLLSFGLGHSMAQVGLLLSQQGDNLVVGRWLGPAALGVYGRAYSLMVMPAQAFGRIVNRVLFPVMAQVQDQTHRLLGAYERGLAVVALISLPVSAFLWVAAPEVVLVVLGPKWGDVVLPFRLFTISLLFRMGSKISDACIKAAGKVYTWASLQFMYAALVIGGALIGQRWGLGGVAVCVSIAMGVEWLCMAQLSRSVTRLDWTRFIAVHVPGTLLALVIGVAAAASAAAAHTRDLPAVAVLLLTCLGAATVGGFAVWLYPGIFLGRHGTWAIAQAANLLPGGARGPLVKLANRELFK
jgi:O-antigen/teichoic acid export membrane protein